MAGNFLSKKVILGGMYKYVKKHWLPGCPACNKSRAKFSGQGMYIGNFLTL
jgi:hypothetical protein